MLFYHAQYYFLVQYKRGSRVDWGYGPIYTPPPPPHRHTQQTHTQTHTVVDYPEPSFEIHVVKFLINEPRPPPRKTLSLRPPTPPKNILDPHMKIYSLLYWNR